MTRVRTISNLNYSKKTLACAQPEFLSVASTLHVVAWPNLAWPVAEMKDVNLACIYQLHNQLQLLAMSSSSIPKGLVLRKTVNTR